MILTYSTVRYGEIDVCWTPELEGGGMSFGQDYLPVVANLFGHVGRVFEFCAGPGFIGFSLLAHGLCDSLALIDVNPAAVAAARETVRRNGLEDRVTVYLSDGLDGLPADERCDLFVANPPHFPTPVGDSSVSLLTDDLDWRLHRACFTDVARFLAPGGSVLLQENSEGGAPAVFLPMIEAGGLQHVRTLWYAPTGNATVYYLWAKAALPGLIADDGDADPVSLDLTDPPTGRRELSRHTTHALRLHNRTGRLLSVWVTDAEGEEPLGRVAREFLPLKLPVEGKLTLPRMALRPGDYVILDDDDVVLARLRVPE
jgi:SAM-dependent methyltransferase